MSQNRCLEDTLVDFGALVNAVNFSSHGSSSTIGRVIFQTISKSPALGILLNNLGRRSS